MSHTIAAIATGPVRSAIGILRLSGPQAAEILAAVFTPAGGRAVTDYPVGTLIYGALHDSRGRVIDQCLATYSRGPRSYTGEDTAELQCHGSPVVLSAGLEALFAAGARQAGRGEFTKRAFLNGKMDLTQAEAVVDLIDARSAAAARHAAGQLEGAMSRRINRIYDGLVDLMAHFHAVLDYPDEDIEPFEAQEISRSLEKASHEVAGLLATARRGRLLAEGVPTAIVGRPNAGKSSLLNALLGYDRAIVTDIPGTTRDTIEERVELGGVLLRLTDTAGLRDTADPVEQMGVERSRRALEGAELALALVDGSRGLTQEDAQVLELAARAPHWLLVWTKADISEGAAPSLPPDLGQPDGQVTVSALTGAGLAELEGAVARLYPEPPQEEQGALLTNARQTEAAQRAARGLEEAAAGLGAGMTPDAVLSDVEVAMAALGEVTGRTLREDITSRIFERFCVGK